jgi:hypothetical protein
MPVVGRWPGSDPATATETIETKKLLAEIGLKPGVANLHSSKHFKHDNREES